MMVLIPLGMLVFVGILAGCVVYLYFFRLLFKSHAAQCPIPLQTIFGLFFRRVSPQMIINSYIDLHKAGLEVSVEELEARFKEGINVRLVARAVASAQRDGHTVDFAGACEMDLAGKDVMKEIGIGAEMNSATTD